MPKKDLGMIAMAYGYVYVARVAMGASDQQTLSAFLEADAYDGPSLIIAYSHCIAHGYRSAQRPGAAEAGCPIGHLAAVPLQPALVAEGKNPLTIDSKEPTVPFEQYAYNETRYRMLLQSDEQRAENADEAGPEGRPAAAGICTSRWLPCTTKAMATE